MYQTVQLENYEWSVFSLKKPNVEIIRCQTKEQAIRVVKALNVAGKDK